MERRLKLQNSFKERFFQHQINNYLHAVFEIPKINLSIPQVCEIRVVAKLLEFLWEYSQILNKDTSPYFHSASLVIWPLTTLKRTHFSELSISRFTSYKRSPRLHAPDPRSENSKLRMTGPPQIQRRTKAHKKRCFRATDAECVVLDEARFAKEAGLPSCFSRCRGECGRRSLETSEIEILEANCGLTSVSRRGLNW